MFMTLPTKKEKFENMKQGKPLSSSIIFALEILLFAAVVVVFVVPFKIPLETIDDSYEPPPLEHTVKSTAKPNSKPKTGVPYNLIFTDKENVLETKSPREIYDNVMRNIFLYKAAFSSPNDKNVTEMTDEEILSNVYFLTDKDCRRIIAEVTSSFHNDDGLGENKTNTLLGYFDREPVGMFRGDICRVAALYKYGGYYMDVDLKTVTPYIVGRGQSNHIHHDNNDMRIINGGADDVGRDDDSTFVSVSSTMPGNIPCPRAPFFNAFIASSAEHPILKRALNETMIEWYDKHSQFRNWTNPKWNPLWRSDKCSGFNMMGTDTLSRAYYKVQDANNKAGYSENNKFHLLEEINLSDQPGLYSNFTRQEGVGCCCQYIVHDPVNGVPYFFSRAPLERNILNCGPNTVTDSRLKEAERESQGAVDVVIDY